MSQILHLEYTCTHAELMQAQTLSVRKQLGGGSKWRTRLVLILMLVGLLMGAWFRFREIPEGYRAMMIAAVVVFGCLFSVGNRRFRKNAPAPLPARVEVSEKDFAILGPAATVTMPWSAFCECLESTELFVLLDRPKGMLIVVPKRAFPGEEWQTWFREQVTNGLSLKTPASNELPALAPSTSSDRVTFRLQLGYRDYLDRTLASWLTWGMCLAVAGMFIGVSLYSAAHPPPRAVISATKVFFMFVVPFYLVIVTMITLIFSTHGWLSGAKYNVPQEIAVSEAAVEFASTTGSGTLPWSSFKHYKETHWSFIIWRGSHWMLFPKRTFASWDDLNRCRELLDSHLQRSRWFFG